MEFLPSSLSNSFSTRKLGSVLLWLMSILVGIVNLVGAAICETTRHRQPLDHNSLLKHNLRLVFSHGGTPLCNCSP